MTRLFSKEILLHPDRHLRIFSSIKEKRRCAFIKRPSLFNVSFTLGECDYEGEALRVLGKSNRSLTLINGSKQQGQLSLSLLQSLFLNVPYLTIKIIISTVHYTILWTFQKKINTNGIKNTNEWKISYGSSCGSNYKKINHVQSTLHFDSTLKMRYRSTILHVPWWSIVVDSFICIKSWILLFANVFVASQWMNKVTELSKYELAIPPWIVSLLWSLRPSELNLSCQLAQF